MEHAAITVQSVTGDFQTIRKQQLLRTEWEEKRTASQQLTSEVVGVIK